jgi:hypothetical protein
MFLFVTFKLVTELARRCELWPLFRVLYNVPKLAHAEVTSEISFRAEFSSDLALR